MTQVWTGQERGRIPYGGDGMLVAIGVATGQCYERQCTNKKNLNLVHYQHCPRRHLIPPCCSTPGTMTPSQNTPQQYTEHDRPRVGNRCCTDLWYARPGTWVHLN